MSTSKNDSKSILRGTALTSALTLISRALGFVRDLLTALLFGANTTADAFFVAFRIPNLLRSLVAEGALTSGFVPVLSSELRESEARANKTFQDTFTLLVLSTLTLTSLGVIFAPQLSDLFAPGFKSNVEQRELCIWLTRLMFPYIIFVSAVSLISSALNTVKIFGAAAFAQVCMNLVLIFGALLALVFRDLAIELLAYSVLVGGIVQIIVQLPRLRSSGFKLKFGLNPFSAPVRSVLKLMIPAIFGAAIYQLSIFMNTVISSLLGPGSVSWLFYADRLVQLPIGVFTVALATVLLPTLSNNLVDRDRTAFAKNLSNALRFTIFLIVPLVAVLIGFSKTLVSLVFERGAFSAQDVIQTSQALVAYAFGILAVSCHSMLVRGFIASKNTKLPSLIAALSLILNLILSLVLIGPLSQSSSWFASSLYQMQQLLLSIFNLNFALGHVGLAWASSLANIMSCVVTFILLYRRHREVDIMPLISCLVKTVLAATLAIHLSNYFVAPESFTKLIIVPIQLIVFTAFFIFFSYLLKIREYQETFSLFLRELLVRGLLRQK